MLLTLFQRAFAKVGLGTIDEFGLTALDSRTASSTSSLTPYRARNTR